MTFSAAVIERLAEQLSTRVHRNRLPEREASTRVLVAAVASVRVRGVAPSPEEVALVAGLGASSVYGCARRLRERGLLVGAPGRRSGRPCLVPSPAGQKVVERLAGG